MSQDLHGPDHYIPDEERTYAPDEETDRDAPVGPGGDIETPDADAAEQQQVVDAEEDDEY